MSLGIESAAPTGAETTTLHVAIEISRKIWAGGIKSLQGEKIGLHTLRTAEVADLETLIEQRRSRAERARTRSSAAYGGACSLWLRQAHCRPPKPPPGTLRTRREGATASSPTSRAASLPKARKAFPGIRVIHVDARSTLLKQRLA